VSFLQCADHGDRPVRMSEQVICRQVLLAIERLESPIPLRSLISEESGSGEYCVS